MILKKQKSLFLLLLLLTLIIRSNAQTDDSLLNQLSRKLQNAKSYTLKIATLMPEDGYNFKPVPDEMTFGKQLLHIAQNMNWLTSSYLNGSKQNNKLNNTPVSKQEILNTITEAYDTAIAVHSRLKTQQLDEIVPFFAGPLARRQILILLHDHQAHHVGQLIVYLRLKGIKPPDYVGW